MVTAERYVLDFLNAIQKKFYIAGVLRDASVSTEYNYIKLINKDKKWLVDLIIPYFNEFFDLNLDESKIYTDTQEKLRYVLSITSENASDLIQNEFEMLENQSTWNTPSFVTKGTKEELKYYIQGYWDVEGGATRNPSLRTLLYIDFTYQNKESIEFIREKLLLFGVKAGKVRISDKRSMSYRITITGRMSILNFIQNIGSQHPEKQQRLNRLANVFQTNFN